MKATRPKPTRLRRHLFATTDDEPNVYRTGTTERDSGTNEAGSSNPGLPLSDLNQDSPKQEAEQLEPFELTAGQTRLGVSFSRAYTKALGIAIPSSTNDPFLSLRVTADMRRKCRCAGDGLREYNLAMDPATAIQRAFLHFTANDFVVPRATNVGPYWAALVGRTTERSPVQARIFSAIESFVRVFRLFSHLRGGIMFRRGRSRSREDQVRNDAESIYNAGAVVLSVLGTCLAFLAASFLYGGIHLVLAWNGPINTTTELILWRICCFTLLAPWALVLSLSCIVLVLALLITGIHKILSLLPDYDLPRSGVSDVLDSDFMRDLAQGVIVFFLALLAMLLLAFACLYLFSRVYVVVECLISLPYAPVSVFSLPSWSAYFIHVS